MVCIIVLGRCCRITRALINIHIKGKTSLFEWCISDDFDDINKIIEKIINNENIDIVRKEGFDYLSNTNIKTCHYLSKDYSSILLRRSQRFIENIKNNKNLLFIRDNGNRNLTVDQLKYFYNLIHKINPNLLFKFVSLTNEIKYDNVYYSNYFHYIYKEDQLKKYIRNCFKVQSRGNIDIDDISDNEKN